jgi:hypothetical protein
LNVDFGKWPKFKDNIAGAATRPGMKTVKRKAWSLDRQNLEFAYAECININCRQAICAGSVRPRFLKDQ